MMEATRAEYLRTRVQQVYSSIATNPGSTHPFPIGRALAKNVGYSSQELHQLPPAAVEAFAGVSAVSLFANLESGATLLDLGCGAGLDSLIAARRVGSTGRVIGVDFSASMLIRARHNAVTMGLDNLQFLEADAERLPLADGSIDVVLVNGIFNLNPARTVIFAELARVVQPGGAVYVAELVLRKPLPPETIAQETDWFA
jgi:SAM-dependent methyltransferase